MCEPTTILMVSAAVIGAIQTSRQAQETANAAGKQAQVKAGQASDAAGLQIGERAKQARAERARLRVAAGEAGVSGQSYEAQLAQVAFDQNAFTANTNANNVNQLAGIQAESDHILASVQTPGVVGSGLQIAAAGAAAHSAYTAANPATVAPVTTPMPALTN